MGALTEQLIDLKDPGYCQYCLQETRSFCDACQKYVCLREECQNAHSESCELGD
jgi:hypothetical protein